MFVLPFTIPESPQKISLADPVFSIGSCFADEMGVKLAENKFNVVANPFGTIYNPYSIFKNLRLLLSEGLDPDNYVKNGDIFYHWDAHSSLSGTDLESFRQLLKTKSEKLQKGLLQSKWMILTLGTALVYKYRQENKIVANCHKIPGKEFDHFSLTSLEIIEDYHETMELLRAVNPEINVILSVSPVRHIRDGLMNNNVSKATLLQAVHEITEKDKKAFYFPAYELMIDVLRDYRFYAADMIHPSPQAVDYIWQRFTETFMDEETRQFISQWTKIKKSISHRPFHPSSSGHQAFLKSTIKQLKALESKVDITPELQELEKQLV